MSESCFICDKPKVQSMWGIPVVVADPIPIIVGDELLKLMTLEIGECADMSGWDTEALQEGMILTCNAVEYDDSARLEFRFTGGCWKRIK